jgi:hypothetical protein
LGRHHYEAWLSIRLPELLKSLLCGALCVHMYILHPHCGFLQPTDLRVYQIDVHTHISPNTNSLVLMRQQHGKGGVGG